MKKSSLLMRYYFLFQLESHTKLHVALASCFSSKLAPTRDLSEGVLETLLVQSELSWPAKERIFGEYSQRFKTPISLTFSKSFIINNYDIKLNR